MRSRFYIVETYVYKTFTKRYQIVYSILLKYKQRSCILCLQMKSRR